MNSDRAFLTWEDVDSPHPQSKCLSLGRTLLTAPNPTYTQPAKQSPWSCTSTLTTSSSFVVSQRRRKLIRTPEQGGMSIGRLKSPSLTAIVCVCAALVLFSYHCKTARMDEVPGYSRTAIVTLSIPQCGKTRLSSTAPLPYKSKVSPQWTWILCMPMHRPAC